MNVGALQLDRLLIVLVRGLDHHPIHGLVAPEIHFHEHPRLRVLPAPPSRYRTVVECQLHIPRIGMRHQSPLRRPRQFLACVEDPKLVFYLKNVIWRVFTRQVGYRADYFKGRYDFALSFAGPNRDLAKTLHELLAEREVASFYDENEQHRIIAQNIEDYLAPIYRSV